MELNSSSIVIIGAGPAGCSTSLFLAKHKIAHTIIDKAVFPRDKVCGDALSGKTVYVLNQLDPTIIPAFDKQKNEFIESWGVKFVAPNGKAIDIPFKQDMSKEQYPPGFISKRIDFDNELFNRLDKNYATVIDDAEVTDILKTNAGTTIKYKKNNSEFEINDIKILVGAEGDRSIVAKKLSPNKKENEHYCAGIRAYYQGVTGMHNQNFIELHFLPEMLPGYFWIFPLPNGMANVGAGMLSSEVSKRKVNLKADMLKAIENNPAISARFKNAKIEGKIQGWGLPLGSKKRPVSGEGFLLVGDAGSLIDPFTGEGIGNALYSGMMAANHITEAIKQNRFDAVFLKQYDDAFYNRQWDELKLSHTMQKLVKFPWLFNFVVNKAHKNKALRETISCMFEDLDLRAKLRNPLFYIKLLKND
ncbi:MAG: NAD(P)/FAD-dependent oxidoreductase [Bacteroidia bacterium]|nr:NAD(P)/FAD-dependent oxidoreductase [Bacteroidia bacterium]MBP9688983.1 NAD(P)/FAD-dependent oxidoreductase [Bacteroidia bacterium]